MAKRKRSVSVSVNARDARKGARAKTMVTISAPPKKGGLSKKAKKQVKAIARKAADGDPVAKKYKLTASAGVAPFETKAKGGITQAVLIYQDGDSEQDSLTAAGGQLGAGQIIATDVYVSANFQNSCHDPWGGAGGHQPRGWDQIKATFAEYRVVKLKGVFEVCCRAITIEDQTGLPFLAFLQSSDLNNVYYAPATSSSSGFNYDLMEQSMSIKRSDLKGKVGRMGHPVKLKMTITPKRVLGHNYEDEDGWTAVGSNPSSSWLQAMRVLIYPGAPGTTVDPWPIQYWIRYKLYYTVQFRDSITDAPS